ncbi:MAG: hypothetical protein GWN77_00580, partial [Gammaproteobacteria bacterium]|nr:hypothetical protein [Gammaproteobacteria bacterium]
MINTPTRLLFLVLILTASLDVAARGQFWEWSNPQPQGNGLAGMAYD